MSRRRFLPVVLLSSLVAAALIYGCVDFSALVDAAPKRSAKAKATNPVPQRSEPVKSVPAAAECRWAASPVVLDGKADEPAWEYAQVIENFGQPWKKESGDGPVRGTTKARLLWDGDYLYFLAEMKDTDLFADVHTHDGMLWTNDAFELFLKPSTEFAGYYEFEVNAANAVLDVFYPNRDLDFALDQLKRGEFRVETKVNLQGTLNDQGDTDKGWRVEGRIPWIDFLRTGGRPEPGEVWQFNLCRYNQDQKKPIELTATAPIREPKLSAYVHQHEDFAGLKFVGPSGRDDGSVHAIARNVPVTTSNVIGSPEPPLPYKAKRLYPGYSPQNPILAKPIPGTDQLLVITENMEWGLSVLWRIKDDQNVKDSDAVRLFGTPDKGLAYDACFHPKFTDNHYLYVGWAGDVKGGKKKRMCRITRYTLTEDLNVDLKSAKTIIEWDSNNGHNGLSMCFDSKGLMYVTSGDGSSDSDSDLTGQSTDTLLSKVMRLDVDHPDEGKSYSIPPDNPYVADKRFAPETWAYGLRNPWRMTADAKTDRIWVGNNGQDSWEQAYLIEKGANYGWSVNEGGHSFNATRQQGPHPISMPTIEHSHSEFRSLTGGIVFYGDQLPDLEGAYIYGDYSTGRVWAMKHDGQKVLWHKELSSPKLRITNFAQNHRGELIICDHTPSGGIYTLEPAPKTVANNRFPKKLSESGLFESVPKHSMKPGVVPYSVNAPFWSDGMYKERHIVLPPNESISSTGSRGWNFPDRTVLVKSFALEREEGKPESRKWVETRFFTRQEGEWRGYSYRWNEEGTDADLVDSAGRDEKLTVTTPKGPREQVWHYPSRVECLACHSRAANFVLGLCTVQMNKDHDYGNCTQNQLSALQSAGLLKGFEWTNDAQAKLNEIATAKGLSSGELNTFMSLHGQQSAQRRAPDLSALPIHSERHSRLVDPYDAKEDLTQRAKSWLHANCSSCHIPAGGGNAQMELEFSKSLRSMNIVDVKPIHATFGIPEARLIAPGDLQRSVLLKRISTRGLGQMPQLSTNRVDEAGVALIREWIESLKKQ